MASRLSMSGLVVSYGGVRVLHEASLEVAPGETHALLGENGAGKSTLLRSLLGLSPLAQGQITVDGVPFVPSSPARAMARGIAMIHQELSVLPHLSVAENIQLVRLPSRFGFVQRRRRDAAAERALTLLGRLDLPLSARTGSLPPGERQLVEIARAVALDARIVIMDEPTSSLGAADQERLFDLIASLQGRGISIVYVSHFLPEVRRVAQRYTAMRDGRTVHAGELARTPDATLVLHMAGRSDSPAAGPARPTRAAAPASARAVLSVRSLRSLPAVKEASFDVHEGEILGVGGLCGAGRTELLQALFGLRPRQGEVLLRGAPLPGSPAACWRAGMGLVAEDRKLSGLDVRQPIAMNVALPSLARVSRRGWLGCSAAAAAAEGPCRRLGVRLRSLLQRTLELSGGNQQKVAFARLLLAESSVLLLDEPTRGVDVHSRAELFRTLRELGDAGAAIVLVSSQLTELLQGCDRIAIMRQGVLLPAQRAADCTQESLLAAAVGAAEAVA